MLGPCCNGPCRHDHSVNISPWCHVRVNDHVLLKLKTCIAFIGIAAAPLRTLLKLPHTIVMWCTRLFSGALNCTLWCRKAPPSRTAVHLIALTHFCPPLRSTFADRETNVSRHKGGTRGSTIMPRDVSLSDTKCWNGGHEWVNELRFLPTDDRCGTRTFWWTCSGNAPSRPAAHQVSEARTRLF